MFENVLPMREAQELANSEYLALTDVYSMQIEEEELGEDSLDSYATTEVLDAKYEKS